MNGGNWWEAAGKLGCEHIWYCLSCPSTDAFTIIACSYSYVQKARDKSTGELVAVKCIRKEPMDYQLCEQIEQEVRRRLFHKLGKLHTETLTRPRTPHFPANSQVELQRLCKHKHVVEVLDFVDTKSMYFIVMKLLNGGDLLATIVGETREVAYSERTAADTVKAMACALAHIHAQGIAHLDVKPDNILYVVEAKWGVHLLACLPVLWLCSVAWRLTRLYVCVRVCVPGMTTKVFSSLQTLAWRLVRQWTATLARRCSWPQRSSSTSAVAQQLTSFPLASSPTSCSVALRPLSRLGECSTHARQAGSLACPSPHSHVCVVLLLSSLDELSHAIKHGRWDFYSPYWDHISKEARDLIRRMLSLDPTKRPTAQEVHTHTACQVQSPSFPITHTVASR